MELKKASRKKVKIKIGINGPSGSGKTMGALKIAKGLCGSWAKIGVVDTENGSASLYEHLGDFLTLDLSAPFSPERYIEAIQTCENAGMEVIIIDSGTQEWSGIGGYNDLTDRLAEASFKGNSWSARSKTMPRHRKFIDYILQSKCHIIVCNRSKVETVMGDDKKVKKIGMKEIQDGEFEYEMSIVFTIDRDTHTSIATKDRTEVFEGKDPFIITEKTGIQLLEWCEKGIELQPEKPLTPELPSVTDNAVVSAIQRYTAGETEIFTKLRTAYKLTESQEELIKNATGS
jgi:hypothetical protein